ncbi:MAG: hypothetical protein AAFY22_13775, partial [Pseudomonadota bacterium]
DLLRGLASRMQAISGPGRLTPAGAGEEAALARLAGFEDFAGLKAVADGAAADARNALAFLQAGPQAAFAPYRSGAASAASSEDSAHGAGAVDAGKLEDLGFSDGAALSRVVDTWADGWTRPSAPQPGARFSAVAPGLLTAFGEAQHPDEAVALFDRLMETEGANGPVIKCAAGEGRARDALVDAIGCFGGLIRPLTASPDGAARLLGATQDAALHTAPDTGAAWLSRNAPPAASADPSALAAWRAENIAAIAASAAARAMPFGAAAEALEAVHNATLATLFTMTAGGAIERGLTLHVFDGPARGLPGARSLIGFLSTGEASDENEADARTFVEALYEFDNGRFAFAPEVSHRPGGVGGPLAPDEAAFKAYVQSEAVASDQILLARARVIAGEEGATARGGEILRAAVSNPKRADILFRDLDRARMQRMRRERAASEWDLDRIEGGLSDIELIVSTLIYRHAAALPALQKGDAGEALAAMARANVISGDVAATLTSARAFWTRLATVKALADWKDPQQDPIRKRFAALLAAAAEVDRFQQVRPLMRGYAEEANRLYSQLVLGRPAVGLVANA